MILRPFLSPFGRSCSRARNPNGVHSVDRLWASTDSLRSVGNLTIATIGVTSWKIQGFLEFSKLSGVIQV